MALRTTHTLSIHLFHGGFLLRSIIEWRKHLLIVNVILVDYRALDTLGEMFVLALAAIGVIAMLKLRHGETEGRTNSGEKASVKEPYDG